MKLEKKVYIGEIQYNNLNVGNKNYKKNVSITILSNEITDEELKALRKIQSYYKAKLTLEIEEPILDEAERKYLSDVIRPFRDKVIGIYKYNSVLSDYEEIAIDTREDYNSNHMTHLPPFKEGTMYKGMELNKEYTLDDLNL